MKWRYRAAFFFLFASFLLIIARLFYWQIVKAEELSLWGQTQYGKNIKVAAQRGEIKTSDGFSIAANKTSYLLFANPKQIKNDDKNKIAVVLSSLLQIDSASISAQLSQDLFWIPIKSELDTKTKERVEKLNLSGLGFEQQSIRFYPEASVAAQLIGFVGKNESGEDKGYFGIEGFYDRLLRGKSGASIQIHDALGNPIVARINDRFGQENGRSLTLGIDRSIQFMAEKKLSKGIEKYGASGGMIAIMDPRTGKMLAMASFPSFDPRNYKEYEENLYKNPIISNTYEPGSTFKTLIMAAALDARIVKPETKCPICGGPISIGGYEIKTWNNEYKKDITMTEIIQHSDNTGMVYVGKLLGLERMSSYLKKFGIGETTGIDLQGEVGAALRQKDRWYPIDLATASFGQGISITAIQLLSAFSAIANEGKRMKPHVVTQIEKFDGEKINIEPQVIATPITSTVAKVMTEILVNAVDKGEAKWAKPKGYRIAGKTGTAQIPIAGHYDQNKTIASFIGFAPADDPKFAMLVIIDRPTTSIYGAETAAPIFFDIAKDILTYYNIPPNE